jgi:hypothetical protein
MGFDLNGVWGPVCASHFRLQGRVEFPVQNGTPGSNQASVHSSDLVDDRTRECEPYSSASAATFPKPGLAWA